MHEQERCAGSIVIDIHYDGEGTAKRAWVQARVACVWYSAIFTLD
jgi:hypothetical protein